MEVRFLGATETVTGSRYLVTSGRTKALVDCGLFQGQKNLRLRNWLPFSIRPSEIDGVILTHAHLDHSGYLPKLIQGGFGGRVFCTAATKDLCRVLLPDSGYLQEEEARFANKHGYSKHRPARPLYTEDEAEKALASFDEVEWGKRESLRHPSTVDSVEFEFHPAGHLLGAASVLIRAGETSIAFSGDLGRASDPITRSPSFNVGADYLVVESTYGNRRHTLSDPKNQLKEVILRTFQRGGTLLIPAFAVGRAQLVLHYIRALKFEKAIPDLPVYLNSPMAARANDIFCRNFGDSKMSFIEAQAICATARSVSSVEESIALNRRRDPIILIAASGMATGGRVLHHLKAFAPDPKNTILFVGFQASGTRGAQMANGDKEIKIHGALWPVRAEVVVIDSMSAHADADEILLWIRGLNKRPRKIFVTHGEPAAAHELKRRIQDEITIEAVVPEFEQSFSL